MRLDERGGVRRIKLDERGGLMRMRGGWGVRRMIWKRGGGMCNEDDMDKREGGVGDGRWIGLEQCVCVCVIR